MDGAPAGDVWLASSLSSLTLSLSWEKNGNFLLTLYSAYLFHMFQAKPQLILALSWSIYIHNKRKRSILRISLLFFSDIDIFFYGINAHFTNYHILINAAAAGDVASNLLDIHSHSRIRSALNFFSTLLGKERKKFKLTLLRLSFSHVPS